MQIERNTAGESTVQHVVLNNEEEAPSLLAYYRPLGPKSLLAATMMQRQVSRTDALEKQRGQIVPDSKLRDDR